jgi:hypothetical protein
MIRLRQIALVARELDPVVEELCSTLGLSVCFNDPGVGTFGLHNALLMVGDQFLEVVAPVKNGTTAGRLLDKRGGDGGYMAIYEVDDLDERDARLAEIGVRTVWSSEYPDIRSRHLHPRDVPGAIVSIDETNPWGAWRWGGPDWTPNYSLATGFAGVIVGAEDPAAAEKRWADAGVNTSVRFVAASERGEGIDGVELIAADRNRVGECHDICGVRFTYV